MNARLKARFWSEVILAALTATLGAVTAVVPTWIEAVFQIDPDHGSGAVEWAIVGVCFAVSLAALVAARVSWRAASIG